MMLHEYRYAFLAILNQIHDVSSKIFVLAYPSSQCRMEVLLHEDLLYTGEKQHFNDGANAFKQINFTLSKIGV